MYKVCTFSFLEVSLQVLGETKLDLREGISQKRDWLVDLKLSERPQAVSRWIWGGEINDFDIIFPVGLVVF